MCKTSFSIQQNPYMMKRLPFVFTLLALLLTGVNHALAQGQEEVAPQRAIESVEQFQELVAQRNPGLKASFNSYLASLERVPQMRQLPDPQLAFGYFIQPIETRVGPQQARLSISQMMPWFGKRDAQASVAEQKAKAAYHDFVSDRNALFYRAEQLWHQWYELEATIRLLTEHIRILNSFEQLALRQYEVDIGEQIDVLRVQMQRDDVVTRKENLVDQRQELREKAQALTRSDQIQLRLPDTLAKLDRAFTYEQLVQQVRGAHPQLEALEMRRSAAQQAVETARLDGRPDLGLGLDYIFTGERSGALTDNGKDAVLAKATISIPIYRKGERAQVKEAQLNQRSMTDRLQARQDELGVQVEQSLQAYRDAQRRIVLYQEGQLQRIQQALDILIEQYSTDGSDFEEILRLESKKLDYRLELERSIVAQHLAEARIRYLTNDYPQPQVSPSDQ
ncbi:MAG: TolC family protein [Bacteroidota bacterium]